MARMSGRERARILHRVADLIRENADEFVRLESLDVGKPVTLCRAVDVLTAAEQVYEYYSSLAQTLDGATRETPINAFAYTRREPLGVVAAITPVQLPADPVQLEDRARPWPPATSWSTSPPTTPR